MKPGIFYIETVLGCNLRCPECPMGNKSVLRKKDVMTLEQYMVIADKIAPYAKVVYPFIWGEPTLNPDFVEIVKYTKQFAKVYISTNANKIDRELAKNLMAAEPDVIDVPLDAATEETYQLIRRGGTLQRTIQGIRFLQQYKTPNSIVRGQFVVFKQNEHELPAFKKLCEDLQIPTRINKPLSFQGNLQAPDNPEFRRPHYCSLSDLKQDIGMCEARVRMVITIEGNVIPCCFDYNASLQFGNIFERAVEEIWNSPKYKDFRFKLMGKKPCPPEFCMTCPRFTMSPKLEYQVQKLYRKKRKP